MATQKRPKTYDVAVVGGGLSGMAAALALAAAGARPILLDRASLEKGDKAALHKTDKTDPRATALSLSSVAMLTRICGKEIPALSPVSNMHISDGHPAAGIWGDALKLADETSKLAHIVPNDILLAHLRAAVRARDKISFKAGAEVTALDISPSAATLTLSSGNKLTCNLVVAADGRDSTLRRLAGIEIMAHQYGQSSMVCRLSHSLPHKGVAYQLFKKHGPLATLPLGDLENQYESALVWSEKSAYAKALMSLDDAGFKAELAARLDGLLGDITQVTPRLSYPLGVMLAKVYSLDRLVLLGEAAHIIHPLAGQGYNLSLRDAACLADCFFDAKRLGLPVGSAVCLAPYAVRRQGDTALMATTTHGLNTLFASQLGGVKILRQLGLGLAGRLPQLSKLAFKRADDGGASKQDVPRLMRGAAFTG